MITTGNTEMIERDLVFVGGGHSHALVLRMLAMKPIAGVRLTLVSDTLLTPYSGMLPGYLAGHYSVEETHLDLPRLCQAAQVRFIHARVTGIDLERKQLQLADQPPLSYDRVSINTGSTPNLAVPGAREFAIGVKPISQLTHLWQDLLDQRGPGTRPHWAVIGGGPAGIEVVLAIAARFAQEGRPLELSLVQSGATLLPTYGPAVQRAVAAALKRHGIHWVTNFRVAEVTADRLIATDGQTLAMDKSLWCTPAAAPMWPGLAGLAVDEQGFIAVNAYLQSTSNPEVFACGDVAAMVASPRPKAGVFAVRSAPFLLKNLRAVFAQQKLKPLGLQRDFLTLISLGDQRAVGQRNGIGFSGRWVWRWKDSIDRKFMALFGSGLPGQNMTMTEPMHCAGCGSKVGPGLLAETLRNLPLYPRAELAADLTQAEDAAVALRIADQPVWQSLDGFRAFTDDLYRLGVVATHHAINDLYAMGIAPTSAQVWANLAFSHPRLLERDFTRLMTGISQTLIHHETTLIGGHSSEGQETHVALVVNGAGSGRWPKSGLQHGDWLLLNKPLGSGILLAAGQQNIASTAARTDLWQHLLASNRDFFIALQDHPVHAATDVTGFGLVGHLLEMVRQTDCKVVLDSAAVPLMVDALALSEQGVQSSLWPQLQPLLLDCRVGSVSAALLACLLDPQTNGGLLIAVPAPTGALLVEWAGVHKIGTVETAGGPGDKKIAII